MFIIIYRNGTKTGIFIAKIEFTSFKCFVSIIEPFALDLRGSKFGALIGFEPTVIRQSQYGTDIPNITNSLRVRLGSRKTGLSPQYFYTDRSKAVLLLWFLTVTRSCCPYLYFGSAIMLVTYFVNFR